MNRSARDALSLYVGGTSGLAFLLGLLPVVNLLFLVIGLMFAVAALLGAIFVILVRLRQGRSPEIAFLELAIIGALIFVTLYGAMWYFISYVPSQGSAMFTFQMAAPTPRPK